MSDEHYVPATLNDRPPMSGTKVASRLHPERAVGRFPFAPKSWSPVQADRAEEEVTEDLPVRCGLSPSIHRL